MATSVRNRMWQSELTKYYIATLFFRASASTLLSVHLPHQPPLRNQYSADTHQLTVPVMEIRGQLRRCVTPLGSTNAAHGRPPASTSTYDSNLLVTKFRAPSRHFQLT
ncbi:hypothetical protein TSMEX_011044 [Taenia solium]|eukprot:TsM_000329400 transcript=TsM_000329400 gene=TsM_000329400